VSRAAWLAAFCIATATACRVSSSGGTTDSAAGATAADSSLSGIAGTPVRMGAVARRTIEVHVSGTGGLDVLDDERVRAPFNGILTSLTVNVGDRVTAGQVVGSMIAENSDAALRGARSMVSSARTDAERTAARQALRIAEANIVHTPLAATKAGIVIARPASAGERLAQGDSVISVAATSSMVFFANIAQSELRLVRPGQRARIHIAARKGEFAGVVHNIMPADTASTATMRVRIDVEPAAAAVAVGAFGIAVVIVNEHVNVPAVPNAALLRDDVTGRTQIALVRAGNIARWTEVVTGVADSAWTEIRSPRLAPGQRVITMGLVGLPDSTRVVAAKDSSSTSHAKSRP
jgi:multidrug efflux pump subunit AcrA (membrane-fusion protein)